MGRLKDVVAKFDAKYSTNFQILDNYGVANGSGDHKLSELMNLCSEKAGVALFYDEAGNLLSISSSINLKNRLKAAFDCIGPDQWKAKGIWCSEPHYVICVVNQNDLIWEKDSLKGFLIEALKPYYKN